MDQLPDTLQNQLGPFEMKIGRTQGLPETRPIWQREAGGVQVDTEAVGKG